MLGELGGMLFHPPPVDLPPMPRHVLMTANAQWGDRLFVQRLAEESVGKSVGDRGAVRGPLLDDRHRRCFLQYGVQRLFGQVRNTLEHIQSELPPNDGRYA